MVKNIIILSIVVLSFNTMSETEEQRQHRIESECYVESLKNGFADFVVINDFCYSLTSKEAILIRSFDSE